MAWYFQTSPHDTHDWDSAQTPILIDGDDQRQAAQAGVDRRAQRLLLHRRSRHRRAHRHDASTATTTNWAKGIRQNGAPEPDPEKEATIPGSLVSPVEGGVDQLAAAGLFARHRPVLRAGEQRLQHALSDRSRSARIDGARRQAGASASGSAATLSTAIDYQDRQDGVAARSGRAAAAAAPAC